MRLAIIAADVAAAGAVVSTLVGWLPPLAAFLACLWYALQLYESKTVQTWLSRQRSPQPSSPTAPDQDE